MTSPSSQQMDRDLLKPVELDPDFDLSEDEEFSDKSESVSTENKVHVEIEGTGIVYLPEDSCRAIYKHKSHPKGARSYICIHGENCGKRIGGYHTKLQERKRAASGYYKGLYENGNLKAALHGTFLSDDEVEKLKAQAKTSDRNQARAISAIGMENAPELSGFTSDKVPTPNLDDQANPSTPVSDKAPALKPHDQAELLKMMNSLCIRLDSIEKAQSKSKTDLTDKEKKIVEGILRPSRSLDVKSTNADAKLSLSKDRHAAAALNNVSGGSDGPTDSSDESTKSRKLHRHSRTTRSASDLSEDSDDNGSVKPKPRRKRKSRRKKTGSKYLYAIAKGKGGSMTVGLYQESFDKIAFLVEGRAKGRYRKVKTEEEGMEYINDFLKSKGMHRPKWIRDRSPHYPSLKKVQRHVGLSSDSSSDSLSDSDLSVDTVSTHHKSRSSKKKKGYESDSTASGDKRLKHNEHIGIDPSLGKDNELFNISIKNVNGLEEGLGPSGIGKTTRHLLLEQIEDMTAYPRHSSTSATEGIGELVEAVTGFKHQEQEKLGGSNDTGWKHKNRNVLGSVKSSNDLNNVLSYLLEEQHTILETCAGNMESVLINARVGSDLATQMVASSLGFRISRDTLHSYFSLLNHLAGVNSTSGWELCKEQLSHHSEKIGLIRNKYRSRLQMVCKIYIYLREGQSKNWMSLKLHTAQLNSLTKLITTNNGGGTSGGTNTTGYGPCSHCKTTLHGGGKNSCPWKDESSAEAKKKAKKVLLQMGSSSG